MSTAPAAHEERPASADAAGIVDERSIRLWTPERIPLALPLAGLGERALSYGTDLGVIVLSLIAAGFVYNFWGDLEEDVSGLSAVGYLVLLGGLLSFAVGYDIFFETLFAGRTPGKMLLRLRVLKSDGSPPDFVTSSLRNLARIVDMLPSGYGVGALVIFFTRTQRLGDLLADTVVVSERARGQNPMAVVERVLAGRAVDIAAPGWSSRVQLEAVALFIRARELEPELRERLARRFLKRELDEVSPLPGAPALLAIAAGLLALGRGRTGPVAELMRAHDAERALDDALAALKGAPRLELAERADDAIRHAGSALMRATRRGLPSRWLEPLSLALLDAKRSRRALKGRGGGALHYLLVDVPRALVDERALVLRAAVVLASCALVGGTLAYASEPIGRALLGDEIASLVDAGARWTDRIEQDASFGRTAVTVILNNIRVGLVAFVFGLLGGVGTLLVVGYNGLHLGAVFGFALRLGVAGTLGRFILAHGPVELTSICVAGAAGLVVGRAITRPGDRTRVEALREEGRVGARLIVAATLAFLFIGTVEGFVSPGRTFPVWVNATVGVSVWALLFFAIRTLGAMERRPASTTSPTTA